MTKSTTEKPRDLYAFPLMYDTCRFQVRSDDSNTPKPLMEILLVITVSSMS